MSLPRSRNTLTRRPLAWAWVSEATYTHVQLSRLGHKRRKRIERRCHTGRVDRHIVPRRMRGTEGRPLPRQGRQRPVDHVAYDRPTYLHALPAKILFQPMGADPRYGHTVSWSRESHVTYAGKRCAAGPAHTLSKKRSGGPSQ